MFVCFVHCFLKLPNADISQNFRFLLGVLGCLRGGVETKEENDQSEDDWRQIHGRKIARARIASRTPSNGLATANQKETFQPDSWVIELVFTLFSQAIEDRYFGKVRDPLGHCRSVLTPAVKRSRIKRARNGAV
jgi:hypothetical protein